MSEKVCDARREAWERLTVRGMMTIDATPEGMARPLPFLIPCPAPDAPHPGCGAKAGEACAEPTGLGDAFYEAIESMRGSPLPCGRTPGFAGRRYDDAYKTSVGNPCGYAECPRRAPIDATPETDVGELRVEIERLRGIIKTTRAAALELQADAHNCGAVLARVVAREIVRLLDGGAP